MGSHLVGALLERGHRVTVLDDLSSGRREQVPAAVELVREDVRDPVAVRRAVAGCEVVYHLAARPSVARSLADPETTMSVNAHGTLVVLAAARAEGARRVVVTSSSSVYGGGAGTGPVAETSPLRTLSPYAASKAAAELLAAAWATSFGLETAVLRLFNVYGPRQRADGAYAAVVPRWVEAACTAGTAPLFGDGRQSRDFTFVDDVVEACVRAGEVPAAAGQTFNVSGGRGVTLLQLARMVEEATGRPLKLRPEPARGGEVRHSVADLERARATLGWRPAVPLVEGLRRVAEHVARAPAVR